MSWGDAQFVMNAVGFYLAVALGLWAWRKRALREMLDVPFEADMPEDQIFQGFNLSEIEAAQAVAAHGQAERRGP